MNRSGKWLATLLLLASTDAALAAEKATIARDTELRSKALGDAAVVQALKAGTPVTINTRSGAWAQVSGSDGKTGYVRLLNLRSVSTQKGDSGVGALANVFRTGSSGRSVATGVKGMSEEQLTGATPSPEQAEKLSTLRVSEKDARSTAALAGLKATQVAWLPAPATDKNSGGNTP